MLYTQAQLDARVEEAEEKVDEEETAALEAVVEQIGELIAEFVGDVGAGDEPSASPSHGVVSEPQHVGAGDEPSASPSHGVVSEPQHVEIARRLKVLADGLRDAKAESDELRVLRRMEAEIRKAYSPLVEEAKSFDGKEVGHLLTRLDVLRS